ncbi:MAG: hypothetical protein ABSB76_09960 [Streptosporangiaceae bacterium]|jgi:hypothetical protein
MDAYTSCSWVVRLARQVRRGVLELHDANRRASELMFSFWLAESNRAPDTYAEFLLRSRANIRHEPTACGRSGGCQVS